MSVPFADRRYLVTGAASGIGLAVTHHLAARGAARLVLVDRDGDALARVRPGCAVDRLAGDVSDELFWDDAAPALAAIDGAVLNAGVAGAGAILVSLVLLARVRAREPRAPRTDRADE